MTYVFGVTLNLTQSINQSFFENGQIAVLNLRTFQEPSSY